VRDITYDDADRISRFTHYTASTAQPAPTLDQSFSYDNLDRLTGVTAANNWSYSYDATGNRTAVAVGTYARAFNVSASSNRLTGLTNPARDMNYDATGNTLTDVQSGSSGNYTAVYNLEGRLNTLSQGSAFGASYAYDAQGRRFYRSAWTGSVSNPRIVTLFAYDQDNHLIGEYQADGTPITEYVWLGDTPVAVIKSDAAAPGGIQTYAIHADHLDTPRVILDAQGQVRWRWMGEPFGASVAEEQPTANLPALQQSLRFPGQQYEPYGGRHYNHFRDYDPTTGRYVQSDPIGLAGGLNTYAYVGGNPLSNIDPAGLSCTSVGGPNGRTYCEYPGGPSFDVPRPPGFPDRLDDGNFFYHKYDVTRDLSGADARCVMAELRKNATPGKSNGASTNGTVNIAKAGPFDNPVISYVTKDNRTGDRLIVNITFNNGAFADGYVARGVVGNTVHTWGEGTAVKQSPNAAGVLSRAAQYAANELLWGGQMDEIIKKCACQK
jgi:RHS repeat-associated protein